MSDDANGIRSGECPGHEWDFAVLDTAGDTKSGHAGLGLSFACRWCGATRYEPSNFEKFPDTQGLDPKLYPAAVARLRRRRGW